MLYSLVIVAVSLLLSVEANFNRTRNYKYASCDVDPACRDSSNGTGAMMTEVMRLIEYDRAQCILAGQCPTVVASRMNNNPASCVLNNAAGYQCSNVDLLAFISLTDLGGSSSADGNDIWGWTDPITNDLYAIVGLTTGTSFVRVTNPLNPVVVAWLASNVGTSTIWRDMKVYGDYVYIVADRRGQQLQYYDMSQLKNYDSMRVVQPTGVYSISGGTGSTHNIVMNGDTGMAFLVGGACSGGLYMMDTTGGAPVYAGCFASDGYTHDAQCVTYDGVDTRYQGHEICFNYNEDTLTIVDVTDLSNFEMLARVGYNGAAYTHQGWLTDDHNYLFLDDELDESRGTGGNTGYARTFLWDVRDLQNPVLQGYHDQGVLGIDHNLYVKGNYVYESNYEAGLRILEYNVDSSGVLGVEEVAFFDTYPEGNSVSFNGAWSVYPYFEDFIILQDINRGLFILQATALDAEKAKFRGKYPY